MFNSNCPAKRCWWVDTISATVCCVAIASINGCQGEDYTGTGAYDGNVFTPDVPVLLLRVPVKVAGMVKKGQRLVAGQDGTAQAAFGNTADYFAIALESSDDTGVKLVEAVIL